MQNISLYEFLLIKIKFINLFNLNNDFVLVKLTQFIMFEKPRTQFLNFY